MRFNWHTDVLAIRRAWRPSLVAHAEVAHGQMAQQESDPAGLRDAGWAELWSRDGETRLGRGHLMLWADPGQLGSHANGVEVHADAVQPLGDDAGDLRAELRTFTPDAVMPEVGASYLVVPEGHQERHVVDLLDVIEGDGDDKAILQMDWPNDELPMALAELGGH